MTTTLLTILTLTAAAASLLALWRLQHPRHASADRLATAQATLTTVVAVGAAAAFLYRWLAVTRQWQPLSAHVDGLLLMSTLFAGMLLFIESRRRLTGLTAFALPLLTLLLAWAVCAAAWTYRPFQIDNLSPVWTAAHLAGVYLGTLVCCLAAIAGGMYLFVRARLKHKRQPRAFGRLASLETLESLIVRAATLGFALLSVGLVAGLVILSETASELTLTNGFWWKVALAAAAWLVYALLMNVRYASRFRGARAAWLSIAGILLLLAVYSVVVAWPMARPPAPAARTTGPALSAAVPPTPETEVPPCA